MAQIKEHKEELEASLGKETNHKLAKEMAHSKAIRVKMVRAETKVRMVRVETRVNNNNNKDKDNKAAQEGMPWMRLLGSQVI